MPCVQDREKHLHAVSRAISNTFCLSLLERCAISDVCFLRGVLAQGRAISELCSVRAVLSQPSGAQCRQARHVIARHGSAGTRPTYLLSPGGTTHFIFTPEIRVELSP